MVRIIEHGGEGLRRLFAALVEQIFQTELGVADPPLTDYLADLLYRFLRFDSLYEVRDPDGRRCEDLVELISRAEREREAHCQRPDIWRQIGDVTLFWSGVYPEVLAWLRRRQKRDGLLDFPTHGKRSYYRASELGYVSADDSVGSLAPVLRRLGDEFDLCRDGLTRVRREWEAMSR